MTTDDKKQKPDGYQVSASLGLEPTTIIWTWEEAVGIAADNLGRAEFIKLMRANGVKIQPIKIIKLDEDEAEHE